MFNGAYLYKNVTRILQKRRFKISHALIFINIYYLYHDIICIFLRLLIVKKIKKHSRVTTRIKLKVDLTVTL